jgi:hypothetical protein
MSGEAGEPESTPLTVKGNFGTDMLAGDWILGEKVARLGAR